MSIIEKECKLEKSSQKNTNAINELVDCLQNFTRDGEKRISLIIEDIRKAARS